MLVRLQDQRRGILSLSASVVDDHWAIKVVNYQPGPKLCMPEARSCKGLRLEEMRGHASLGASSELRNLK
jgi:hypothetical protein